MCFQFLEMLLSKEGRNPFNRFLDKTESKTAQSLCRQIYGMVHFVRVCAVPLAAKVQYFQFSGSRQPKTNLTKFSTRLFLKNKDCFYGRKKKDFFCSLNSPIRFYTKFSCRWISVALRANLEKHRENKDYLKRAAIWIPVVKNSSLKVSSRKSGPGKTSSIFSDSW